MRLSVLLVVTHLLEARVLRMQPLYRLDVGGGEQRARRRARRVAQRPQMSAVGHPEAALDRIVNAVPRGGRLDQPDGLLQGPDRVVLEPECERQVEHHLAVGRAVDIGEQARIHRQHQVAPQVVEPVDEAVVHEEPLSVPEGMAVRLLDG